ncbi:MAG: alanine racemase [Mycobacteriales bacterium]
MTAAADPLRQRRIGAWDKGFGPEHAGLDMAAITGRSITDGSFLLSLMLLRESALAGNVEAMAAYCADRGVLLCPHAKTTMAPAIWRRQLAAGAWGLTAATISQARAYREFGVTRILLANQLVDPAGIGWLVTELTADPTFGFSCYVDSLDGVALLDGALRRRPSLPKPLPVLVELGLPGGRTGCRTDDEAEQVAGAVGRTATLRLTGIAGYEGTLGLAGSRAVEDGVRAFCRRLREVTIGLHRRGLLPADPIVTAGGSGWFDVVTGTLADAWPDGIDARVVLRSGSYVAHDDGMYAAVTPVARDGSAGPAFVAAIEVWAHVLSRPEADLLVVGAGRRDVAFDDTLPIPLTIRAPGSAAPRPADRLRSRRINDQHLMLSVDRADPVAVGDVVTFGVSHPCTAFDKWRRIPVVDDDYRVLDVVDTYF